jgi:hypothetical protein
MGKGQEETQTLEVSGLRFVGKRISQVPFQGGDGQLSISEILTSTSGLIV